MKLPRDLSGRELGKALSRLGYEYARQVGGHIRYVTSLHGEHHETIPDHKCLRVGTVNTILRQVAEHHGMTREELLRLLFG